MPGSGYTLRSLTSVPHESQRLLTIAKRKVVVETDSTIDEPGMWDGLPLSLY